MPNISPVANVDLTTEEEAALVRVFGGNAAGLQARLAPFASAALREYIDMFLGQAVTTASDVRERRLVAMMLALPPARFPKDDDIARWFNLTPASARSLLRTTLARHRHKLRAVMDAAARSFIGAAGAPAQNGDREARFPNSVVIDMLNEQLAAATAVRKPIRRKADTFDTYVIPNGSMIELAALYP